MAGAPAAAAETPLPPSARALASAPAFATSEGERGAGGDGDGEGEGDELLSDSETIPPPSFKVLLVDARSGLTSHARGYRTQYKSVLLGTRHTAATCPRATRHAVRLPADALGGRLQAPAT